MTSNSSKTTGNQTVWIARHGNRVDFVDPDWVNRTDRPYDPPLSEDGEEQARQLAERLTDEGIGRVVSSPFLRTLQTAHIVADRIDTPVSVEPGVCEWLNPAWFDTKPEPLPVEAYRERFSRIDFTYTPLVRPTYPEEHGLIALERAARSARQLVDLYNEDLLIIGHGVSVAGAMLGLQPNASRTMYGMCALVKVVRDVSDWRVELNGDTSHLTTREDDIHYH
jgi:broad specificity phosphatase PhoE